MYRRPSKKIEALRRLLLTTGMILLILVGVTTIVLIILGYRYDSQSGQVEQGALIQYDSQPTGATVTVDGRVLSGKTPTKNSVLAGVHTVTMSKDGYETWTKTFNVKAGTLTWLDYARLVPTSLPVASVASFTKVFSTLASTQGQTLLVQPDQASPSFDLFDLSSDSTPQTTISLPTTLYSEATTAGIVHRFRLDSWDPSGRYVLIEHSYGTSSEWIELDTKNVTASINMTKLLNIPITSASFSGSGGNTIYVLNGTDVRKLDLAAATISRSLIPNVTSFSIYDTNVMTFVGTDVSDPTKRVVGVYRDGDSAPHILRTTASGSTAPLHIATSRYFNNDYVAISEGSKVDILYGSYPTSPSDDGKSLVAYDSFDLGQNVDHVGFSPDGYYILAQNGSTFAGYDIEHKVTGMSSISATTTSVRPLQWLDNSYVWSDADNQLTIREFDGTNARTVNETVFGQAALLTKDGKYIYSIGKSNAGYQLQRIRLLLP